MAVNIADVESESIVDGPGFRFAVYTQGCPHGCPGCHNPQTHAFEEKRLLEAEELMSMVERSPFNSGVTLSGGEPFCQAAELLPFARMVKERGMSLWAYSGYTFEQLTGGSAPDGAAELLALCDVLVDGPFLQDQKSYDLKWKGSANQRVIDLAATRDSGEVVLFE